MSAFESRKDEQKIEKTSTDFYTYSSTNCVVSGLVELFVDFLPRNTNAQNIAHPSIEKTK